ncbi:calcium-binding protein [Roseomonas sp. M0104]|uniref:Calcium-binding protein n=1 Tax=Teichococcus coralli TaxID=2545983 RepID=A0A845B815_9PROT|nr:calcium-binding protein [Pseudoroseomonas coralli]
MTASPPPTSLTLESWDNASLTGDYASYANLTLTGNGWRTATGNAYDNTITGNSSPNTLDGGAGDDTLIGGGALQHAAGHVIPRGDTFIIRAGEGNDTILDFTPGVDGGDVISLPGFDFRSFTQVMATATQAAGGGVLFHLSPSQTLTVHGSVTDANGARDLLVGDFVAAGADFDYTAAITDITLQPDGQGGTRAVLTGTAEANAKVLIKDLATQDPHDPNIAVDPQVQADATGVWHFTTGPLTGGVHSFAATSIQSAFSDIAQEWHYFEFSTSAPRQVTVSAGNPGDITPPEAPTLLLDAASDTGQAGDGITGDTTPTLVGTAEAGSTVRVYDTDGTTLLGTVTAADGAWSLTTGALSGGLHHLIATATDAANNVSAAAALDLTINLPRNSADFPAAGFDRAFYLAHNPDIAQAGIDPLQHYEQHGWREGRDPNALFHTAYYLNQNPDVAAGGIEPLQHYEQHGWREGRDPSASFSAGKYLAANPDVAASGMEPLTHYLLIGEAQGRATFAATPHATGPQDPLVDNSFYFTAYPDIAQGGLDPSEHFAAHGWREGRNPSVWFDTAFYLAHNLDIAQAGIDPLQHYEQHGWREGRDPNALFHVAYYLNQNPDVAAGGIEPLQHYEQHGWHEGRDPSANFSAGKYLAANPDVAASGMEPLTHYLLIGEAQGRATFAATPHATGPQDPLVDNNFYFTAYPDIAQGGLDPSEHFAAHGWREGRNPNAFFDTAFYLTHYPDIARGGINPLQHYEEAGWKEGRDPSANFSTSGYLAAHPEVAAEGINPLQHFLQASMAGHGDLSFG